MKSTNNMENKVVITGIGIYCPIGKNKDETYNSLLNSKTGIDIIDELDVSQLRNNKGGVIKEIEQKETINGFRSNILLKHAVEEAINDSKILDSDLDKKRISVSIGTSIGGYGGFVDQLYFDYDTKHKESVKLNPHNSLKNSSDVVRSIPFVLLGYEIAKEYQFQGSISSSVTACSASANAITMGKDLILSNRADVVVVGGVDPITQLTFLGFNSLMAMSKSELKIMDEKRSGLLIGEGAACLILEKESTAIKRNAPIYARLNGCGISNDAFHCTQPHPEAKGAVLSIKKALKESDLAPTDIDYINLHGTGTKHNDIMELKAIQTIFGQEESVPVSSSKSMMGHTLGAAGAIEAVICIISLVNNILPPNLNVTEKIKNFNYNIVQQTQTEVEINNVLSNSFGFGGNCASLIFSKYKSE